MQNYCGQTIDGCSFRASLSVCNLSMKASLQKHWNVLTASRRRPGERAALPSPLPVFARKKCTNDRIAEEKATEIANMKLS